MYKRGENWMMDSKFPKIKKTIDSFVYDEEGNIPRDKVLLIGSMVILMNLMITQDIFAKHYSHSSHRSHSSHSSHSSSRHGNHSNHSNHASHNNSISMDDLMINSNPQSTPTIDDANLVDNATNASIQSLGKTPKFDKTLK